MKRDKKKKSPKTTCPKCGSDDIKIMELRGLLYIFCNNEECDHRGQLNEKSNPTG